MSKQSKRVLWVVEWLEADCWEPSPGYTYPTRRIARERAKAHRRSGLKARVTKYTPTE